MRVWEEDWEAEMEVERKSDSWGEKKEKKSEMQWVS